MNELAPLLLGAALGATMAGGRIGFAVPMREALVGRTLAPLLPMGVFLSAGIALHAIAFGAFGFGGGFVAPAGLATMAGALLFGAGMQVANGCGSGSLVALGSGSRRMLAVVPTFVAGSFLGTLDAAFWDRLPAFPAVSLGDAIGWAPAAALQLLLLYGIWRMFGRPWASARRAVLAALLLAALAVVCLPLVGHPWGITWGFALAGAKTAVASGWLPAGMWAEGWPAEALAAPLLADTTVLMDLGLVAGALAATVAAGRFGKFERPALLDYAGAALGGLAMGYGARISGGCNVGAFVGGVVSGSPHGWLWLVACLAGSRAGIAMRPLFRPPGVVVQPARR
ncbi:MAG: YeeE/YedE family protein [Rhodospirillales bacterium]|nr:YeeE/YedE family protein [Rhodospirillales bacterium]